jgi:hypothetical protein
MKTLRLMLPIVLAASVVASPVQANPLKSFVNGLGRLTAKVVEVVPSRQAVKEGFKSIPSNAKAFAQAHPVVAIAAPVAVVAGITAYATGFFGKLKAKIAKTIIRNS